MNCCCQKCGKMWAVVLLIVGLLFLAADFGWFNWGISWYTAGFLLVGLCGLMASGCPDCKKVCK